MIMQRETTLPLQCHAALTLLEEIQEGTTPFMKYGVCKYIGILSMMIQEGACSYTIFILERLLSKTNSVLRRSYGSASNSN